MLTVFLWCYHGLPGSDLAAESKLVPSGNTQILDIPIKIHQAGMYKGGYLYILTNENRTTLYTGVTSNFGFKDGATP